MRHKFKIVFTAVNNVAAAVKRYTTERAKKNKAKPYLAGIKPQEPWDRC